MYERESPKLASALDSTSSVDSRRKETEEYLVEVLESNPHLITPGARRYFRRVWIGYAVLALAFIAGIWAQTHRTNESIRHDINQLGKTSCIGSIATLNKYNDLVQAQIDSAKEAKALNISRGDFARAHLNDRAIARFRADKLHIPSLKECSKPIIKE